MENVNRNNKYVVYVRKSSDAEDRQVLSIESQLKELKEIIVKEQLDVVAYFEESKSAKVPGRPVFDSVVEMIKTKKANALFVWLPDRLSRNSVDTGTLIYLIDTEYLIEVKTPSNSYFNTPTDKYMLNMIWSMAKFENDTKGVNVKRGMKTKLGLGWYPFVAPHGYLNTPDMLKGYKIIKEDPERFNLVRKLWDLLLTGNYTVPQIVQLADKEFGYKTLQRRKTGGTPISRSGMYDLFTNPFYYGEFAVKGIWYKGAHKPMITKKEFDKAQLILGRGGKPRPQKHISPYTGYILCPECGCAITITHKEKYYPRTGNHSVYEYMHCTRKRLKEHPCTQKPLDIGDAELQIADTLVKLQLPDALKKWALEYLRKTNQIEFVDRKQVLKNLTCKQTDIESNLNKLLDILLSGSITEQEYKNKKLKLEYELSDVKEKLSEFDTNSDAWISSVEESFDLGAIAAYKFDKGLADDKRFILSKVGENYFLKDKKLQYDLKKPYFVFKDVSDGKYEEYNRLEPVEFADVIAKSGVSKPESLSWLPRVDSNHRP